MAAVALIVLNSASLSSDDTALRSRLEALGHTVTILDDAAPALTSGADLVVISPGTGAAAFSAVRYVGFRVPLLLADPSVWDNHQLSLTTPANSGALTQLEVVTAAHPIAAGLTGTRTFLSAGDAFSHVNFATGTTVFRQAGQATRHMIQAFETGTPLVVGTAQNRIVAWGFTTGGPPLLTGDGITVFNAAIAWLLAGVPAAQQQQVYVGGVARPLS